MNQLNRIEQHKRAARARLIIISCLIVVLFVWIATTTWTERSGHLATANISSGDNLMELPYKYLAVGWIDWAAVQVQEISEADPSAVEAHFILGLAAESTGNLRAAQSAYERIAAVDDLDELTMSAALSLLGRALLQEGRMSEAKSVLADALALNDHSASAAYGLGQIAESEGLIDQALDHYQHAIEHSPDWVDPAVRVATIFHLHRDYTVALKTLLPKAPFGARHVAYLHQVALNFWGLRTKAHDNDLSDDDRSFLIDHDIDVDEAIPTLEEFAYQALNRALHLSPEDPQLLALQSLMEGQPLTYP